MTQEIMHELFEIVDGKLLWRTSKKGRRSNIAGSLESNGYRRICIDGVKYSAHHLVWLMFKGNLPLHQIDHLDGNPDNNSIGNLRDVPQQVNLHNRCKLRNNKSGHTGISWCNVRSKWRAAITSNSRVWQKRFINIEDAIIWRKNKESELGFTERHGE